MITYKAKAFGRIAIHRGADVRDLNPRFDLANHSPTGMAWGYAGSGPAQLSLAILADLTDDETALEFYQQFKERVIAPMDRDAPFELTAARGLESLETIKQEASK